MPSRKERHPKKDSIKPYKQSTAQRRVIRQVAEEQCQLEMELQDGEAKYRSLISYIPDVVWTIDQDSNCVFMSKNVKSLTGYSPEEEYKMGQRGGWSNRIHPDDVGSYTATYNELIEKKKPFNVIYRFKHKDGRWVWIHDRAIAAYEKDGMEYAYGLITDITEHKAAEAEIRKLKEKYESVIRNIPEAIYSGLPDETCSMVFISDRYKDWTGYSPRDFYRNPGLWPKTVHPEDRDRAVRNYIEAWKKKEAYLYEYRVVHKDTGQIRWVRDHGVPVIDQEGKLILFDGIMIDITKRKVADRVLQSYYTSITAAHEEERKKIARELHDETLQSLSMVLNNLNEAFLMCKESAPEISLQLKNISTTLRDMMDGLRRFSHELRPSLLDKFGLVPSLEMLTEEVGRQGSLECHLEIVNSEQRIPDEAELALFRIAQEALRNVRKHSKATEAVVSIEFNESKATLSVTDNGIGFQVDRWQSELAQNGKFGLIGMRERASLLRGQLTVESEMGKGTTIRVEIPSDIKTQN